MKRFKLSTIPTVMASTIMVAILLFQACKSVATNWSSPQNDMSPSESVAGFASTGLKADAYKAELLQTVDLYNGGLDGRSGARVYQDGFDGYFQVNLDRQWQAKSGEATTAIAQSRWIFMNATAHQAAREDADGEKFLTVAIEGIRFLFNNFRDWTYGGYYYQVDRSGKVVNDEKTDFANCQTILAFTTLYSSVNDPWLLRRADDQIKLMLSKFADAQVPGGIIPSLHRDFSRSNTQRYRNSECITHLFEGLLAMHEVVPAAQRPAIAAEVRKLGNFITKHIIRAAPGLEREKYFAFYFDEKWGPSQVRLNTGNLYGGSGWVSVGHNFEMAFLLSRAVEMGFDKAWLTTAEELLRFGIERGMLSDGGGIRFLVDYQGKDLGPESNPNANRLDWWPQLEAARALIHFAVVRHDARALAIFKKQEAFMRQVFIDKVSGGWYGQVSMKKPAAFVPLKQDKSDIWQDAYHQTMYFAEVLRLASVYP